MNWLTAKVAQAIALALLLACLALGAKGCSLSSQLKAANAERDTAQAERNAAITERDAWKAKTEDAQAANRAYGVVLQQMQEAEAQRQAQEDATARRAAAAVAAAQAEAVRARRERDAFARRFADKPATCAAALDAMQSACPSLERY